MPGCGEFCCTTSAVIVRASSPAQNATSLLASLGPLGVETWAAGSVLKSFVRAAVSPARTDFFHCSRGAKVLGPPAAWLHAWGTVKSRATIARTFTCCDVRDDIGIALLFRDSTFAALLCLRFPSIQEFEQNVRRESAGILEFTILLANNQLAVAIGDGQCRDAFIERNLILLDQIGILFFVRPKIYVHHFVACREKGCDLRALKREVQHMAVKAPVGAENQQ